MKKLILILLLGIGTLGYAEDKGIVFTNDTILENVLLKARAENKYIFIDCYAVWCGPCKYMSKNIFTDEEVGNFHNAHFINLKYDMEKPYGIAVKKKYSVKGYPTYLYLDPSGELVHRGIGSTRDAESFLGISKTALDTTQNFKSVISKIEKGDRTAATINQYLTLNYRAADTETLINDHFRLISDQEKFGKATWELLENLNSIDSEPFRFILENRKKYEEIYGKKTIDDKIYSAFSQAYSTDKDSYEALKAIDPVIFEKNKREMEFRKASSMFMHDKTGKDKWTAYIAASKDFIDNSSDVPAQYLNNITWTIYENYKTFKDKEALKQASEWAKKMIDMEPEVPEFLDTYAHIRYDLGDRKSAAIYEEKALSAARKAGSEAADEIEANLKKFRGKK